MEKKDEQETQMKEKNVNNFSTKEKTRKLKEWQGKQRQRHSDNNINKNSRKLSLIKKKI